MTKDSIRNIERAFKRALQDSFFGIYGQLNLRSIMMHKKSFFELLLEDPRAAYEIVKSAVASEEGAKFFFEEAILKALALALGKPGLEKELAARIMNDETEKAREFIKKAISQVDP
ncbi:MAG: hypothetical protein F7C07_00280 [Desulfurococcales archaeon]|nr:hypothetical protein [Desulfurococcales archaeon]